MNLLDRLLHHDAWTTRQLLRRACELTDGDLDRTFDIGLSTVRATSEHMIRNVEVWTDLMRGHPIREAGLNSVVELIARFDEASAEFIRLAQEVDQRGGWDKHWLDTLDDPPTMKTFGGAIAHIITHNMHHRAQLLFMLRRLGVADLPEGDMLSWEKHVASSGSQR